MYFHVNERVGEYGEEMSPREPSLGSAAVLVPVAVAAAEALVLVLSAAAVAYGLHLALEKAKRMGIGVAWAEQKLMQAMDVVVESTWKAIRALQDALEKAGQQNLPPKCQNFVQTLKQHLKKLRALLANRNWGDRAGWLSDLRGSIDAARVVVLAFVNECLKP